MNTALSVNVIMEGTMASQTERASSPVDAAINSASVDVAPNLYAPLKLAVFWLAGTYLAFLTFGQTSQIADIAGLTIYIALTIAALAGGYWLHLSLRARQSKAMSPPRSANPDKSMRGLTLASGIYVAVYGLALLQSQGATGPLDVIKSTLSPGQAYFAKFRVYEEQLQGPANPLIQILTLMAVLYIPLVPFTIVFWKNLNVGTKAVGLVAVICYVSFYLYVGTLKGLGDLFIFAITAALVVQNVAGPRKVRAKRKRRIRIAVGMLLLVFVGYMAFNQSQRVTHAGLTSQFTPNPVVSALTNEQLARGISVVAFYPTHGYLGLSKNLGTPFEWTNMRGSSVAVDSYLDQYGFGESVAERTYPARTEVRTGWPAGMYWATAYPWLASDLTFPGVIGFMGFVGWWLARFWCETVLQRSKLALLLLSQIMLFLAFIPANNQIGISRPATIGFLTLCAVYVLNRLTGRPSTSQPVGA